MKKERLRSNEEKKQIMDRINRISGQVTGIKNMTEDNRGCEEILIQLTAIKKSVHSLACLILENHIHSCLNDNSNNQETIDEIVDLVRRYQ